MKRLENFKGKNEGHLKAIKDQGEKQLNILSKKINKEVNIKNASFKNKLDNDIKEQNKRIDYIKLVCIGSSNHYHNFTIFLGLEDFAENIYFGALSLKAAKIQQRCMEDMIKKLENYRPNHDDYKIQKINILSNAREFYKERKMILFAFKDDIFPLPKQYPSGMDDWEEKDMDLSEFMPQEKESSILLPSF